MIWVASFVLLSFIDTVDCSLNNWRLSYHYSASICTLDDGDWWSSFLVVTKVIMVIFMTMILMMIMMMITIEE